MSPDSTQRFGDQTAAQQRFLSLFLRSEREVFRYVAALVPNVPDAEDIVQQTALALWEKFDAYDPTQPFTPWGCRFALNKAKQWMERRQRGLLHDVLRVRHIRHQRRHVTKNLPLAAEEQRKKPLLRGVLVFGMWR